MRVGRTSVSALVLAVVASAASVLAGPAAHAAVNCNFDSGTGVVQATPALSNDPIVLSIAAGAIRVNGVACSTATTANTNSIEIHDTDVLVTNNDFTLDLSGGPFVKTGGGEIPITIYAPLVMVLDDTTQLFTITGAATADDIRFGDVGDAAGEVGVDVTGDGDVDLTISDVHDYGEGDRFVVNLGAGDDSFKATGAPGFAADFPAEVAPKGGVGNDTLIGGAGSDSGIDGGDGDDTLKGGAGADTLNGAAGGDTLKGEAGSDTELGGADDDIFDQGSAPDGADVLTGGTGTDKANYGSRTATVSINQDELPNDGEVGEGDIVTGMEKVFVGSGNDTITGTAANDVIDGGGGNDTISAGGGDDLVDGGLGNDLVNGDAGNDTLKSSAGTDTLNGGIGDDVASMGAAKDGATTFHGGAGSDTVDYSQRTSAVVVQLDAQADDGAAGELDRIDGVDVENVKTGSGSDWVADFVGKSNIIAVGAGHDLVSAGSGADAVTGGDGNDKINGDGGNDIVHGNKGWDTVDGDDGDDKVYGDEDNDLVIGGNGADAVYGGYGTDQLKLVDNRVDTGSCGAGSGDKASADASPRDSVGASCESVKRI